VLRRLGFAVIVEAIYRLSVGLVRDFLVLVSEQTHTSVHGINFEE
jgi:hypothetical protein